MRLAMTTLFLCGAVVSANAQRIDLARSELIDLTHPFNAQTLYWPTSPARFKLEQLAYGPTPADSFTRRTCYRRPSTVAPISMHQFTLRRAPTRRIRFLWRA